MRRILFAFVLFAPSLAQAWDGEELWNNPAHGGGGQPGSMTALMPGGGGIYATGGARDYNITCASCHLNDKNQQGQIDAAWTFNPPLPTVGGQQAYKAGQLYAVTVKLTGEHLGKSGCDQYVTGNINNFAASIENDAGKSVGVLSSDSGQSSATCPAANPKPTTGSTILYGDCHAIASMGSDKRMANAAQWTFQWQAPAAGTGNVTVYWGIVDGDCMMDSLGDDVKTGSIKLVETTASRAPARRPYALALLILGVVPAFTWSGRRRSARPASRLPYRSRAARP